MTLAGLRASSGLQIELVIVESSESPSLRKSLYVHNDALRCGGKVSNQAEQRLETVYIELPAHVAYYYGLGDYSRLVDLVKNRIWRREILA